MKYILMLTLFVLLSCSEKKQSIKPERKEMVEAVYSSVLVEPLNAYSVNASITGYLDEVMVSEGDEVKAGDVLFIISNLPIQLNQQNAELNYQWAKDTYEGDVNLIAETSSQRELVEALVGQRPRLSGSVSVNGEPYAARRAENRRLKVRSLPEEPLRNACVADMSVAENMALRDFDQPPLASRAGLAGSGTSLAFGEYGLTAISRGWPMASCTAFSVIS